MKIMKKALYVSVFALPVALIGIFILRYQLLIGPIILGLSLIPVAGCTPPRSRDGEDHAARDAGVGRENGGHQI